ncbi:LOW QUALITY PROTEIN: hypothetical protein PHMEG_00014908 [Phytophthora megakarya]|uniref:Uncharacterized protein n=1 Tax=Phytophthora megakarya TaxID=4795 RepID=A0A225W2S6_9STRA|nr:LOW QUALITY PROTEIN: hypothetical protein PHMEG_00014908 [Phytophthora megakarya]
MHSLRFLIRELWGRRGFFDVRPRTTLAQTTRSTHGYTESIFTRIRSSCSNALLPQTTSFLHGQTPLRGVGPLPDNYGGAESGATVVTHKPLADYYKGRCLVASLDMLQQDPGFHFCSFTLVPKKNKPIHLDERIIHDLSAPPGCSVNDQTNS